MRKNGIVFVHEDMNNHYEEVEDNSIILNELPLETEDDKRYLESLIVTKFDTTDVVANRPSCRCGKESHSHKIGMKCGVCNHYVVSPLLQKIESHLWIAAPEQIGSFFSPLAWIMFSKPITSRKFNVLEWMCNPNLAAPGNLRGKPYRVIEQFRDLGIPRGLVSILKNFDLVFNSVILKNCSVPKRQELIAFYRTYQNAIFTRVLPIPSKVVMILEQTSVGTYYDQTINNAIDAAFTAAGSATERDVRKLEARFTSVMQHLGDFYKEVVANVLSSKKGWLRRVLYGNRLNMSYRNIITSRHEPHEYETLIVPYHQLLTCLSFIVKGKLIREYNFSHRDAYDYILDHQKDNDPFLWGILEELIDSTPPLPPERISAVEANLPSTLTTRERKGRGIVTTLTRYPSLSRLSTQYFRIVGMSKCDIKFSVLAVKGPNADFDGDQMTGEIILDLETAELFERLAPHYGLHNTADPGALSHIADMPAPTIQAIANFINDEEITLTD